MLSEDLDKVQQARLKPIISSWEKGVPLKTSDLFISEKVIEGIERPKLLLPGHDLDRVMALVPFVPTVYLLVCPACVSPESLDRFRVLTRAGLIVPVFVAPYSRYPESVVEAVSGYDHISCFEYDLYRFARLWARSGDFLCKHCVVEAEKEIISALEGMPNVRRQRRYVRGSIANLRPFIAPDFELLDELKSAAKDKDAHRIRQTYDLSWAIEAVRTAQAFAGRISLSDLEIESLPLGIGSPDDQARQEALRLTEIMSSQLGIRIPADIAVEKYVELVQDFRPRFLEITDSLATGVNTEMNTSIRETRLLKEIASLNREIERVHGLRRHMLLEAVVGFVSTNPTLVASALIAGALGIGGSLLGCATAPALGAVTDFVRKRRKKGRVDAGSFERLGRKIHRDLQPTISKVIASYVETNELAVQVMAIRKQIIDAERSQVRRLPT